MGLDLTISIETENGEELKNHYYRLNWNGVSFERKFMNFFLPLENEILKRIRIKNLIKKNIYLVEGSKRDYFGNESKYREIVHGNKIKRTDKNLLKIKGGFKDIFISKFKVYDLRGYIFKNHSLLNLLSLGTWSGSNGEEICFLKNEIGIFVNDELIVPKDKLEALEATIKEIKESLLNYKSQEDYIVRNNLISISYLEEFFYSKNLKLISYFG